jgi:hypothetical protein
MEDQSKGLNAAGLLRGCPSAGPEKFALIPRRPFLQVASQFPQVLMKLLPILPQLPEVLPSFFSVVDNFLKILAYLLPIPSNLFRARPAANIFAQLLFVASQLLKILV